MPNPIKYEKFIKEITIIVDRQEKVNYHITSWFRDNKIKYEIKHISAGDYGFIFNGKLQKTIIERKNSLQELSGNLSTKDKRNRFYREFDKVKNCNVYLLIENDNIDNMISGTYGTQYKPNSFMANMLLLQKRYKIYTYFLNKHNMALWMLKIFYYSYYEEFRKIYGR